ncbi:Holliday junction recognition protein [Tenrec ecaudatus]|uniref:Holliday junction recognition protein n=1 Tax=Tenrec ecaudatus TaxID=94439 RepID=UPI003F5A3EB4
MAAERRASSLTDAGLAQKLRDSRCRFQRHMQQLIEKYNHPFEDAPLVEMTTLTYETPEGRRLWGGALVQHRLGGHIQGSPETSGSWVDDPKRATAEDSRSPDVTALDHSDVLALSLMPAVPPSPLRNDLRRKYLTQVDVLLQGDRGSEHADSGGREDTQVPLLQSLASPAHGDQSLANPAHGGFGDSCPKSPSGPVLPSSSLRACEPSTDLAVVPRGDSPVSPGAGSPSLAAAGDVTISDLYEGMLHSMTRLLSAKPSCTISTRTFIVQNWSGRRRPRRKGKMSRACCRRDSHVHRDPGERRPTRAQPAREAGDQQEPGDMLALPGHREGFQSKKAPLKVCKSQIRRLVPSWKELQATPWLFASLGASAVSSPNWENRLSALTWLISPVKTMSQARAMQSLRRARHQEVEVRFDMLHQKYCPEPTNQPCPSGSGALAMYRGGPASPGRPRGSETHWPRVLVLQRQQEGMGRPAERSLAAGSPSSSLLPRSGPAETQAPGSLQGSSRDVFRSLPLSRAISTPRVQPPSCGSNCYKDIKEQFDKLHRECFQRSPQQTKGPLAAEWPSDGAVTEAQCQDFRGKTAVDSAFQSLWKSLSSAQPSRKRPSGSAAAEVCPSIELPQAPRRAHQSSAKRRRLSAPPLCEQWAEPWSSAAVGRAIPSLRGQLCRLEPDWEEQERATQDG